MNRVGHILSTYFLENGPQSRQRKVAEYGVVAQFVIIFNGAEEHKISVFGYIDIWYAFLVKI